MTNYNQLASEIPQHTRVAVFLQEEEPAPTWGRGAGRGPAGVWVGAGWRVEVHGPWPGPCWVIKLYYPPTYKSWRGAQNWHTGGEDITNSQHCFVKQQQNCFLGCYDN